MLVEYCCIFLSRAGVALILHFLHVLFRCFALLCFFHFCALCDFANVHFLHFFVTLVHFFCHFSALLCHFCALQCTSNLIGD